MILYQPAAPAEITLAQVDALRQAGRYDDAEKLLESLLARTPAFHPAWQMLGLIALQKNEPGRAALLWQRACQYAPDMAIYRRDLCELYRRLGNVADAVSFGLQAVKLAPHDALAWENYGLALFDVGDFAAAATAFRRAIELAPGRSTCWNDLGAALERSGHAQEALAAYRRAVECDAGNLVAKSNLGRMLAAALDEAPIVSQDMASLLLADRIRLFLNAGEYDKAWGLLQNEPGLDTLRDFAHLAGVTLFRLGRLEEAAAHHRRAIELDPGFATGWNDLGGVLQELGHYDAALHAFSKALRASPDYATAKLNLALIELKLGKWQEGWKHYEARWEGAFEAIKGTFVRPRLPLPQWNGKASSRKDGLLVLYEQGLGDTIMMARAIPALMQRFRQVGVVCQPALKRLLKRSFPQVTFFSEPPRTLSSWRWHCPMMSLPHALDWRIDRLPNQTPYLFADPIAIDHWRQKLKSRNKRLKIGIAWAGSPTHLHDAQRSLSFESILPLLRSKHDVLWVSLQKTGGGAKPPEDIDWLDVTAELDDFADTAALMENLDLVISVDSAPAHLAGAIGRPIWLLNRFSGEWRWLAGREDSVWYPTMRIFNQSRRGDWAEVLIQVRVALDAL